MNNSKLDIAKDIIESYYDAIRDKPNKTDFQKGIVRGLNLALQILDAHIEEVDPQQFEQNKDYFGHVRHASKFFEAVKTKDTEE